MNRAIIAQTGVADLKFALSEVAENLSAHINASLSKAHGINVILGYVDAYGNDLTTYRDSNGDILGNRFVRFSVGNTLYYAPAVISALAGQPDTTGEIDTSGDEGDSAVGGSAWVTDYTSEQVEQAEAINNDVLVPHTRVAHKDAHGGMTVLVQNTFDTHGHTIATHLIQLRINGSVYNIPVSPRFGGPIQPPRLQPLPVVTFLGSLNGNFGQNGTEITMVVEGGEEWPTGIIWRTIMLGGTYPMEFEWQFSPDNVSWLPFYDIVGGVKVPIQRRSNNCGFSPINNTFGTLDTAVGFFDSEFDIQTPGGGNSAIYFMRLKITNAAGTFYNTTCRVYEQDATGKFLCGLAHDCGYIPTKIYRADLSWALRNVSPVVLYGYALWGQPLADWLRQRKHLVPYTLPIVKNWAEYTAYRQGALPTINRKGWLVKAVLSPICYVIGLVDGTLVALGLKRRKAHKGN
jgi:hypothetical protein